MIPSARHCQKIYALRSNPLESVIRGYGDKAPVAAGSARVRPRPLGYSRGVIPSACHCQKIYALRSNPLESVIRGPVTRLLLQRARRVFGLALMDTLPRCDSEPSGSACGGTVKRSMRDDQTILSPVWHPLECAASRISGES